MQFVQKINHQRIFKLAYVSFIWLVTGLIISGFASHAMAQLDATVSLEEESAKSSQPISLTVTPGTAYLKVAPGNTALHSITLTNDGQQPLRVSPKLVDFTADGLTGQPRLSQSSNFPYLDEDKTSFQPLVLQPNQTAQLTLHISVPARAEREEFPLTVLFASEPMQSSQIVEPVTTLAGTIGSNLIVLITSEQQPTSKLRVEDWQSWPITDSFGQIAVKPILYNDNYAAAVASGSATIKNWRGQEVAKFQIEPQVILAESSRQIFPILADLDQSDNDLTQKISDQPNSFSLNSPFLIGPYTIELTLIQPQESGASAHIEQTTIIALPFSLLITILVIILSWWIYRKYQHHRLPF